MHANGVLHTNVSQAFCPLTDAFQLSSILFMQVPPASFLVAVRECLPGEVKQTPLTCSKCAPSSFSFDPSKDECNVCPANANCTGGALLVPEEQYWHSASNSDYIIQCPNGDACRGSRSELLACKEAALMQQAGEEVVRCNYNVFKHHQLPFKTPSQLCSSCHTDLTFMLWSKHISS